MHEREAELEEIRSVVRRRFPAEEIIEELGSGRKPRDVVLGAAAALVEEIAPILLEAIEQAATGAKLSERDSGLAFYGLHILGGARDSRIFPALIRILGLPRERLGELLGDGLTMTIKRVAIGTFNGDAHLLYALIADTGADEFARYEMFGVLAFLAFEQRIDIAEVKSFLIRFDDERLAPAQDAAWCGWEDAIALLGFRDLAPRVEAAWKNGRTQEGFSSPKHFFADLRSAETDWGNADRFKKLHDLGYIEDIADELSWISDRKDPWTGAAKAFNMDRYLDRMSAAPQTNPMRHVGRNDPCPCGSGKKAKRCCLAS